MEDLERKFLRIRRELRFWTRNTKVILIGVVILCLGGVIFGEYGLWRIIEVKRERGRLEAEITVWQMKQRLLEEEKQRLTSDPFTLEKMARERCGYYKPGELIFVFPDDTTAVPESRGGSFLESGLLLAPSAMAATGGMARTGGSDASGARAGTTSLDKLAPNR